MGLTELTKLASNHSHLTYGRIVAVYGSFNRTRPWRQCRAYTLGPHHESSAISNWLAVFVGLISVVC